MQTVGGSFLPTVFLAEGSEIAIQNTWRPPNPGVKVSPSDNLPAALDQIQGSLN